MGLIEDLVAQLDELDGKTVTVGVTRAPTRDITEEEADRIHEALLRKQRSGSLGLNE